MWLFWSEVVQEQAEAKVQLVRLVFRAAKGDLHPEYLTSCLRLTLKRNFIVISVGGYICLAYLHGPPDVYEKGQTVKLDILGQPAI